jgi:hypothetical protein
LSGYDNHHTSRIKPDGVRVIGSGKLPAFHLIKKSPVWLTEFIIYLKSVNPFPMLIFINNTTVQNWHCDGNLLVLASVIIQAMSHYG